jgi:hypothetical protein
MRSTTTEDRPTRGVESASARCRVDEGTASLEVVWCLPFIFLLVVLVFNLGYAGRSKMRAIAANRLAGEIVIRDGSVGRGGDARNRAARAVEEHYFPSGSYRLSESTGAVAASRPFRDEAAKNDLSAAATRFIGSASSWKAFEIEAQRSAPVNPSVPTDDWATPRYLPDTPTGAAWVVGSNTWTYGEQEREGDMISGWSLGGVLGTLHTFGSMLWLFGGVR